MCVWVKDVNTEINRTPYLFFIHHALVYRKYYKFSGSTKFITLSIKRLKLWKLQLLTTRLLTNCENLFHVDLSGVPCIRPEYHDPKTWSLLQDNAPSHTSLIVRQFFSENQVCVSSWKISKYLVSIMFSTASLETYLFVALWRCDVKSYNFSVLM